MGVWPLRAFSYVCGLVCSPRDGRLTQASGVDEEQGGGGNDLTAIRRALVLAVWLPFAAYAFGPFSPGSIGDPKDFEILTHLCEFVSFLLFGVCVRVCRYSGPSISLVALQKALDDPFMLPHALPLSGCMVVPTL